MRFPKQEIDIDLYLNEVKQLLDDNSCHLFIDTNIISQLYRLNEDARKDFYEWVSSCSKRFHIPNWSVHEYSKRVTCQKTTDYLSELSKTKTYSKELANISRFIKGYVGESLLIGTQYAGDKEQLFNDIDSVTTTFKKISNAINARLNEHQQDVHKEILDKLGGYVMESDIYDILDNLVLKSDLRFDGKIPPGFKDSEKESNRVGDLVIWKEILNFCKVNSPNGDKIKAILISRDLKPDMVYRPMKQMQDRHIVSRDEDKLEIAHESLVYEFKSETGSEIFYLISFYTLVKLLSSQYRNLAVSFQIATEQENLPLTSEQEELPIVNDALHHVSTDILLESPISMPIGETNSDIPHNIFAAETEQVKEKEERAELYSQTALADYLYDISVGPARINQCIEQLKSYNWYKQNPAINELDTLPLKNVSADQQTLDSFFVLGRNILQSADGSSGSAIYFLENLHTKIAHWAEPIKRAFIDGCLYEVFFDSGGVIRPNAFKASYFITVVQEVKMLSLKKPFDFINKQLQEKNEGRFVPKVGSDEHYKLEFSFQDLKTTSLIINGLDVSETLKSHFNRTFASIGNIKEAIESFYAIPQDKIEISPVIEDVQEVTYITDSETEYPF
jgi:hypothetical protein